jgi:hypothetical protein
MKKALIAGLYAATCIALVPSAAYAQSTPDECETMIYGAAGAPKVAETTPAPSTVKKPTAPTSPTKPVVQPTRPTSPGLRDQPVPINFGNATVGGQSVVTKGPQVNVGGLQPTLRNVMDDIYRVARQLGMPTPVITSARDQHGDRPGSLHNKGLAVDLRCNSGYASASRCAAYASALRSTLGPGFDVLFETFAKNPANNHIHIEWDPN